MIGWAREGRKLGKTILQWVLGGVTVLGVIAAAVAYYDLEPRDRLRIWHDIVRVLGWIGIVFLLPWATFFITTAIARRESNAAGAGLVAGYTVVEVVVLLLLVGMPGGAFLICLMVLGVLVALTYNLLVCDWIADRLA